MDLFNKYYFEEYARLSLISIVPSWEGRLLHKDKPDLQNETDDIGIEVTSSISKNVREIEKYGSKHLGCDVTEIEEQFRGEFFKKNGIAYGYSTSKGLVSRNFVLQFNEQIKEKSLKKAGYTHFKQNGLYIFTDQSLIDSDLRLLPQIDKKDFDFLYLNFIDSLLLISGGSVYSFSFSDKQLIDFKSNALLYSSAIKR